MTDRLGPNVPRGICPFCGSAISTVVRDGMAYARCSHRGCGARGPLMRSESRACEVFASGGTVARSVAARSTPAQGYVHATTPPGPRHAKAAQVSDEGEVCPLCRGGRWVTDGAGPLPCPDCDCTGRAKGGS